MPEDLEAGVRLRGEIDWFVSGNVDQVAALAAAFDDTLIEVVAAGSALLRASNSVGRFGVESLGVVELRCGKWDEAVFDAMLSDLSCVATSLPYAADQAAGLPYDRALADCGDVLLHVFLYLRYVVLSTAPARAIAPALQSILRDPHRRFLVERERVPLALAGRADARTFERLATGAETLERVRGRASRASLARVLSGHLPETVDSPRAIHTLDTAENRFVRGFLDQAAAVVDRVERLASSRRQPGFWRRIQADCALMRRVLRPVMAHHIWDDVGPMTQLPFGSTVLQRRRGYRDVLHHHLAMRASTRLPIAQTELLRLLGLKDVARLYELWCFFAVVAGVTEVLGRPPDRAERPRADEVQVDVPWGMRISWGAEIAVVYNLTFSRSRTGATRSSSLQLRPDIVVHRRTNAQDAVHVLDAKLRLDLVDRGDDTHERESTFKSDDIAKMHAYRDALLHVRSAFVLYPGTATRAYPALDQPPGAVDGVGAIGLAPGGPTDELLAHLRRILRD